MRGLVRGLARSLVLVGLAALVRRVLQARRPPAPLGEARWEPLAPAGPVPEPGPETRPGPDRRWVDPLPGGACPASHPVKGNADSGIYHVPGGMFYERTVAERCYATAADAEADGFRPSKR